MTDQEIIKDEWDEKVLRLSLDDYVKHPSDRNKIFYSLAAEIDKRVETALSRQREEFRGMVEKYFPEWPEPQPGAGEEIGPLFGSGMYTQYDADRKKRREEKANLLSMLEEKQP